MSKNPQDDEDLQSLLEKEGGGRSAYWSDDDDDDFGVNIRLPKPGEYVENRKFCCCAPFAYFIIFFSLIIEIDFIMQIFNVIVICQNEYLDDIFKIVYAVIVIFLLVAIVFMCIYRCGGRDSRDARKCLPVGALTAAITDCLLFIWICVYIICIYPHPKVHYKPLSFGGEEDGDDMDYEEVSSRRHTYQNRYHEISKG